MSSLLNRIRSTEITTTAPIQVAPPAPEPAEPRNVAPENATAAVEAAMATAAESGPEPAPAVGRLETTGRTGDFVLNTQETDARFRNVSAAWTAQCLTFDQAREQISTERGRTADIVGPLSRFTPSLDNSGRFCLYDQETGGTYRPTAHALGQMAQKLTDTGAFAAQALDTADPDDQAMLRRLISHGMRRRDTDRNQLVRLRDDGTVRAFLSDQYCIIDNAWFFDVLESVVPDGLVSHLRSDGDSVFFNVLIPDSLRAESDSEYGGMLASGNSEIGRRRLGTLPSVFRAICQNGCIWDQVDGVAYVRKVHRGSVDLAELAAEIRENLNRQIPLLPTGIDRMLALRDHRATGIDARSVVAESIRRIDVQVSRSQASQILESYAIEQTESAVSAFDVVQGFTRAAQGFSPADQEATERAAGILMAWDSDQWDSVFRQSRSITEKQLKRTFADLSV